VQFDLRSKRRALAGATFIVAVAGTVAAVNPAASAGVLSVIQSAVSCATATSSIGTETAIIPATTANRFRATTAPA
jgi:hypothetical protein